MPSDLELLGRLLLAAVLGGAIGAERELNDQPCRAARAHAADHRACLVTLVSTYGLRRVGALLQRWGRRARSWR
jgi:uncharacterized membrane protein YhiD involved in acid resistance